MQVAVSLFSWFYNPTPPAIAPPPEDPPGVIGTWTLDDMHRALATGDVTTIHRKAFPRLVNQLLNQPRDLCTHRNTLPAIEGGVLIYLGTLMQIHPTSPSVHYLALRLVFCLLHAATPAQLATVAAPVMSALRVFRSNETHLSAPEGTLINRTMIGPSGRNAATTSAPAQGNLSPHVIQEIHLMATAILSKISFASSLPPELAQHCADQLLAIAKGNENPRLKRIEEEAARQALQVKAKKPRDPNAPVPDALLSEIETYFGNRNSEMRKVLAKMVEDAIESLHEASDRFAPSGDLSGPDDDGSYETDESMSALFRPDREKISKRSLFDSHSALWLAILEAVGGDIPPALMSKAQAVVLDVSNNSTRSQQSRMVRSLEDHNILSGHSTGSASSAIEVMTTNRLYSRNTFYFGIGAMTHVAQFLRLGYKGGWLTSTDDQLIALYNMFLQYEDLQSSGRSDGDARNERCIGDDHSGLQQPARNTRYMITSGQRQADELLVAILGSFEYILANTDITNPAPITKCLEALLPIRSAQLQALQQAQLEDSSLTSSGITTSSLSDIALPFLQRSCQIAVVIGRICAAITPIASKAVDNLSPLPTPPTSGMNRPQQVPPPKAGGLFWQLQNPFAGRGTSPVSAPSAPSSPAPPSPVRFLRSIVQCQCNGLLTYALKLQEVMESIWLTTHTKYKGPSADTDAMTQTLLAHYTFVAKVLGPTVSAELTKYLRLPRTNTSLPIMSPEEATIRSIQSSGDPDSEIITLSDFVVVDATSSKMGISSTIVTFVSKLLYIEPLLNLLMSSPFANAPIGTWVTVRPMPSAPTSTRTTQDVLEVNQNTANIILQGLKEKATQIQFTIRTEKPPRSSESTAPAGGYVASIAWGVMGVLGSATSAVVTSANDAQAELVKNKPLSQLLLTNYKAAVRRFYEISINAAPSSSKIADKLASEFVQELLIGVLLVPSHPHFIYDEVALNSLKACVSNPIEARRCSIASLSDDQLKVLATAWHRHSGVLYDSKLATLVEEIFQRELALLAGRFVTPAGVAPPSNARELLQKIAKQPTSILDNK